MRKPNFFLIGAPKSGTTSLANWLAQHPQVFFSYPKEPWHFATDSGQPRRYKHKSYESLFADAGEQHLAVGEGSTVYLRSEVAVPEILRYQPNAKFVVMLRRPQDMCFSWYLHMLRETEDQLEFASAWALQEERARGNFLPPAAFNPKLYQYGEVCSVGSQLEKVLEVASRDRVLVLFMEEVLADPHGGYREVAQFLGVDDSFVPKFLHMNPKRRVRSYTARNLLGRLVQLKNAILPSMNLGLLSIFYKLNLQPDTRTVIDPEMSKTLDAYFAEEIRLVKLLVGRVPKNWEVGGPTD